MSCVQFYLFILVLTLSVQQMYDTLDPRPALNLITLFVLWLRLETPAMFSQSMYHTVKFLSRCWRVSGESGAHAALRLYWMWSQGSVKTRHLINGTLLCLSRNTFFQFVSLLILQMPDCSRNFSYFLCRTVTRSRVCFAVSRRSKPALQVLASTRDVDDIFHSRRAAPRRLASRFACSSHPTTKRVAPSYHPSKWGFYGPSKDNELPEWKERSQREVTANTPDAD